MTDKMMDAGYTPKTSDAVPINGKPKAPEKQYPTFTLTGDIPYLDGKKIDEKCMITAEVMLKAVSKGDRFGGSTPNETSKPTEYTLQVQQIGFKPMAAKKEAIPGAAPDEKDMMEKEKTMAGMSDEELDNKIGEAAKDTEDENDEEKEKEYA